jgi:integrase
MEADKARSLLDPLGVDLVQVARIYVEAHALLAETGGSITQAARAYRDVWQARNSSSLFGEAVASYLASRSDLRSNTLASYKYTLDSVFRPLHDRTLADITTADLEGILREKGPTAGRMHHRNLGVFWRWAAKPPRSWATLEVNQATETPRVSSDADIKILNAAEVKVLLSAAELEGPAAAVAYAVAIFGGVRMAELGRLTWGDVLADHIEIGKSIAKKHSRRLIPICPTLRRWINDYRNGCDESSPLVPSNWTEASKNVRRRAGWAVEARGLKDPPIPTRGPWPANACRHTCASVQVANGTSLEDLTFKFGHSGGHDILRAHYVARLTKGDAVAILSIGPKGSVIGTAGEPEPTEPGKAATVATVATVTTPSTLPKNIEIALPAADKVKWPTKAKLAKLVMQKPMTHLAKDLGVSDVAIRKHCVKAGIELPPPGHWQRQRD